MKKLFAMLLMFSMLLAMLVVPTAADGEIEDTFDPNAENPTISTADDYMNFFYEVYGNKKNYEGKTITLLHDITLNDTTAPDWYTKEDAVRLTPTGNTTWSHFKGTFDGNEHTLRGVIVYGSSWRMSDSSIGIFPYAYDATFKNLTVDGFYIYSDNMTEMPVFGRGSIGGLIGAAKQNIVIDNVTMRNGVITAIDDGMGAMGALIGNYLGEMTAEERAAGKSLKFEITNTTVEESVRLEKGNSKIELMGGICGYVEANFAAHPTYIDLSASKLQPSGSMDETNPLAPIGKFRFKGSNDPELGATFTLKNVSNEFEQEIEMDSVGSADIDDSPIGEVIFKDYVSEFNEAILQSGCYGADYQELKSYTVTWDVEGEISEEIYTEGATPSYKGSLEKAATDTKLFEFKGWSPELAPVTADVTYTAQYEEYDKVKVTWVVDGKETVEYYKKGETPTFKGETIKAADDDHVYTFKGWDKDIVAADEEVTYTAQYEVKGKFKITWVVDGKEPLRPILRA